MGGWGVLILLSTDCALRGGFSIDTRLENIKTLFQEISHEDTLASALDYSHNSVLCGIYTDWNHIYFSKDKNESKRDTDSRD